MQNIVKNIFQNTIKYIEKKANLLRNTVAHVKKERLFEKGLKKMQNLSQNEFNQIAEMRGQSQDELKQIAKIIKNPEKMKKEDLIISFKIKARHS